MSQFRIDLNNENIEFSFLPLNKGGNDGKVLY